MKKIALVFFIFLSLFVGNEGKADTTTNVVQVTCQSEFGRIVVSDFSLAGKTALYTLAHDSSRMKDKYGVVVVDFQKSYYRSIFGEDAPSSPDHLIVTDFDSNTQYTQKNSFTCSLHKNDNRRGDAMVRYTVTLEGLIAAPCPQCSCGAWYSFSVTLADEKRVILDKIPFRRACGNDPVTEERIAEIELIQNGDYSSFVINGTDGILKKHSFNLRDAPFHAQDIYISP